MSRPSGAARRNGAKAEREVEDFNARFKVGDRIAYQEVIGMGEPKIYTTATPAEVLSGHTSVVWLNGKSGCVCTSHCKAAP